MKFGCIFLFSVFLLINFQASAAVKCPIFVFSKNHSELNPNVLKKGNCSSCVSYQCNEDLTDLGGYGCPEDFFRDCAAYNELIRNKNYGDLEYIRSGKFHYISACGNESDGTSCIVKKMLQFKKTFTIFPVDHCIEAGSPCIGNFCNWMNDFWSNVLDMSTLIKIFIALYTCCFVYWVV